jgi:hypothetical protein
MINKIKYKLRYFLGFKTRESIFKILPKYSVCAELGVFRGDFSKLIIKHIKPKELHLVDVWESLYGDFYPNWGVYTNFGNLKTKDAYNETLEKIKGANYKIHTGDDLEYLKSISNHYFDWVYIDSSHEYEHTFRELELLNQKVKPFGIIAGHDWHTDESHPHYGVAKAVKEFCVNKNWKVIYNDNEMQWAIKKAE